MKLNKHPGKPVWTVEAETRDEEEFLQVMLGVCHAGWLGVPFRRLSDEDLRGDARYAFPKAGEVTFQKDRDDTRGLGLLRRWLDEIVEKCSHCHERPVTFNYSWDDDITSGGIGDAGSEQCCDVCLPAIADQCAGRGFESREIKGASLVREIVERLASDGQPSDG